MNFQQKSKYWKNLTGVEEAGAHRCGATIPSRFLDLAERTERRQQAILTRELRSEWEQLGRINCKYFS
jgi:hypothetical protein